MSTGGDVGGCEPLMGAGPGPLPEQWVLSRSHLASPTFKKIKDLVCVCACMCDVHLCIRCNAAHRGSQRMVLGPLESELQNGFLPSQLNILKGLGLLTLNTSLAHTKPWLPSPAPGELGMWEMELGRSQARG